MQIPQDTFWIVLGALGALGLFVLPLWRIWRVRLILRGNARLAQGRCTGCGYDLAGSLPDACPECGHHFTEREMVRLQRIWSVLKRAREEGG